MPNYFYYQGANKQGPWKPVPASVRDKTLADTNAVFCSVLAVSKLVDNIEPSEKDKLAYSGPFYLDWDSLDIAKAIEKVNQVLDKFVEMELDLDSIYLYATGMKGFHAEIPMAAFYDGKLPKNGVVALPLAYKEMVYELAVDTLDLKIYSSGKGRMWRLPNVKRPDNGKYKVQVTAQELRNLAPTDEERQLPREELAALIQGRYDAMVSAPRAYIPVKQPVFNIALHLMFAQAKQNIEERLKARGSRKRDPLEKAKARMPSVRLMMAGQGIRPDAGFHAIAMQVSIAATTAGITPEKMIEECQGLIHNHQSDGDRYNTPAKRTEELLRLYDYMLDNPGYDFGVGAIKALLIHEAPDLDNLPVSEADIREVIGEAVATAASDEDLEPDEYGDVAGGVTMSKYGVYIDTEHGKKRICSLSFRNIHLLHSMETGSLSGYEAEILINGKGAGRQTLEIDTFASLTVFNRFCYRHGHAMQGLEPHVRGLMMRFVEEGKKKGKILYISKREGLDMVNIPNHPDEALREPFMVYAAANGVLVDPRVVNKGIEISFQGYPDPRGIFRTDLADAPKLIEWTEDPENRMSLRATLMAMMSMQKPDVVAKLVGWYVACFYRMIFHRAYGKFPLLHVNGPAGSGKSWRKGTLVLMSDGSSRRIEDVKVGEQLLGPDGGVRNVLALGRGQETMYEVTPVKGDPYYVNESHILTLKRSCAGGCYLPNGTYVPAEQKVLNVPLKVWLEATPATHKMFKGYRPEALEFHREQKPLPIPAYILGAWLGDGSSSGPTLHKPHGKMVEAWGEYGASYGLRMFEYKKCPLSCSAWRLAYENSNYKNPVREALAALGVINNKHIPKAYKFAPVADRLELIAGLLDSDGHMERAGYDWISKDRRMAEDFVFICRSVGLAAYMKPCRKGIKSRGFTGDYFRVSISGDCDRIPCKDKIAPKRQQIKNHLVTGLSFKKLQVEDYYGVVLDGDRLLLLADFTVNHNTEMNKAIASLFFYHQEPKMISPGSTLFALLQHIAGSASIPIIIDEYKPHEMSPEYHSKLKLAFRDAYNCRDSVKGGGSRESDDYRTLHHTQLSAPVVFIAEAAEEESAVAERVVLCTIVKPPSSQSLRQLAHYNVLDRNKQQLAILGHYLANQAINESGIAELREEFDPIFKEARDRYMLTDEDLNRKLTGEELAGKQGAKERSVFNYTVVRFGLRKFRALVEAIYEDDKELLDLIDSLESVVYGRMGDLTAATQPEWAKVMVQIASMSWNIDADSPLAIKAGKDYMLGTVGGKDVLEINLRSAYLKYRSYAAGHRSKILFAGDQQFLHAMKDSPALDSHGTGVFLKMPQVYSFDVQKLHESGVMAFRPPGSK